MKTIIIQSLALPLAASLMTTYSSAQKTNLKNEMVAKFFYNQTDDKMLFSNKTENAIKSSSATVPYNKKVIKEFQKKFSNAANVSWELEHNGNYHAFFLKDGIQNNILFNKNGKIIYLINYLSANQLPLDIKNMIENSYDEFMITHVYKISDNTRATWIVSLMGVNHYVMVKVEDGEMEEINRFKLAN